MNEVLSSGGGTQSTCMCALVIQGRIPRPNFVVIADTGREMPTTWQYLDAVVRPALKAIGIEVFRVTKEKYGRASGQDVIGSDQVLIPAFSNITGEVSKLSAFCSDKWKVCVVHNFLSREYGIKRKDYRKWIGFSMDETRRINRMQKGKDWKAGLIRFPLVYDVPTRRQDAIKIVEEMGWPTPPRSRCWMCPNQSDLEWSEVQENHPALFAEAIELDDRIRRHDANAFLHSTVKPLREVDLRQKDDLFSAGCAGGECFI